MRRATSLAFVIVCFLTLALGAQQPRSSPLPPAGLPGPTITITSPTPNPSLMVTTSTVTVAGTADGRPGTPVSTVTWRNNRGGSGVASYNPETRAWTTDRPSSSSLIYGQLTAMPYVFSVAEPSADVPERSYDVTLTLAEVVEGSADGTALIFGYQDDDNYCAVWADEAGETTDLYLLRRAAGALAILAGPSTIERAADDELSVEVRGENVNVNVNGVSRLLATDTACGDADLAGLWVGALREVNTDDTVSLRPVNTFGASYQAQSAAGISLELGANVITVTATDTKGVSSTDTIFVTRTAPTDTRAPVVSFVAPAAGPSFTTSASQVNLAVSASDDTEVTSCRVECTTCAPKTASLALASSSNAGSWSVRNVGLSVGANSVTATCADAAGNQGRSVLVVTRTVADSAAPTILGPASFTTASAVVALSGIARDNLAVTRVWWTCDRCPSGTVAMKPAASVSWTASVALVPGANVVTFFAEDAAGNRHSHRVTVTYAIPPRTSVTIAWDWSGSKTTRFRLWCDNVMRRVFAENDLTRKALGGGVTEIQVTLTEPKGIHECAVSAFDTVGGKIVDGDQSNTVTINLIAGSGSGYGSGSGSGPASGSGSGRGSGSGSSSK